MVQNYARYCDKVIQPIEQKTKKDIISIWAFELQ